MIGCSCPPGASSSGLYIAGLGSYYTRYTLTRESLNIGYDGKGCLRAAQLMPRHAKGWYARAAFESLTTERLNKSNNTVPITRLKTRQATLSAAYRSGRWSLRAGGGYELRRSIEMIADRTGHSVIVDEQAMYKNRIWHADAEATVEWRRGTVNYMLSPRGMAAVHGHVRLSGTAEAARAVLRSGTRQRRMAPSAVAGESDGRNRLLRLARRGGFAQQRAEQHFGIPDLHGGAAERPGRRPRGVPAGRTPPEPESGLLRRGGVDAPVLQRRIVRTRSDGDVRHPVLNDRTNICQTKNKNQL